MGYLVQKKYFVLFVCFVLLLLLISDVFLYSSVLSKVSFDTYSDFAGIVRLPLIEDGYGYYLYLPSILIDGDFGLHRFHHISALHFVEDTGNFVNKYPIGTAILILPFFVFAHIITIITGLPADGFSFFYMWGVLLAGIFYTVIGLWYLYGLISKYTNASIGIITCAIMLFGTNLFFYTTHDPGFSHMYSFAVISAFIYYLDKFYDGDGLTVKQNIILGLLFGIAVIIRQTNIFIIVLYAFYGLNYRNIFAKMGGSKRLRELFSLKVILAFGLSCFAVVFLQMLMWYYSTGNFIYYSYRNEGFNWIKPEIINVLFSSRRGLFFYCPLMLFSILGVFFIRKVFPKFALAVYFVLPITIYVISSWWSWWYGASFGNRAFIDWYPLYALLIASALYSFKGFVRIASYIIIIIGILFNMFLTLIAYNDYKLMSPSMNFAKFKSDIREVILDKPIFLKKFDLNGELLPLGYGGVTGLYIDGLLDRGIFPHGRWSSRAPVILKFKINNPNNKSIMLEIDAKLLSDKVQSASVRLNGEKLLYNIKSNNDAPYKIVIDKNDIDDDTICLHIDVDKPTSPKSLNINADGRMLGIYIKSLRLSEY